MQLAVGWHVLPEVRATVRLTGRFRSAVLRELLRIRSGGQALPWSTADRSLRESVALMAGKDADGRPLQGHRHAEFFVWWMDGRPTRLLVWRAGQPFDDDEQAAVCNAAAADLSWRADSGRDDDWRLRLVPLDHAVAPPPAFDGSRCTRWTSMTPYVPPRHHLRGGKPRQAEAIDRQVRRELALRCICAEDDVAVDVADEAAWVGVHLPRRQAGERDSHGDRRGYRLSLQFRQPIEGPLRLGHSASFGLGLFAPCGSAPG